MRVPSKRYSMQYRREMDSFSVKKNDADLYKEIQDMELDEEHRLLHNV